MSTSVLYQFQEWLEGKIQSILPNEIQVLCRRKGNIQSDIENQLASLGVAVVVEPPLPREWAKTYLLKAETVESEIHLIENVMLKNTEESAYSLLERLAVSLHEERCDEYGASLLTLGDVIDASPTDEPIIHFILPITNSLNFNNQTKE